MSDPKASLPSADRAQTQEGEQELSDSYVRIRTKLHAFGALDTKFGGADRFEKTEQAVDKLLAALASRAASPDAEGRPRLMDLQRICGLNVSQAMRVQEYIARWTAKPATGDDLSVEFKRGYDAGVASTLPSPPLAGAGGDGTGKEPR